jgi:hypothetical protein
MESWARHYDELHGRYEKLCDVLYNIVGLEEHEIKTCVWLAKGALKDGGEWPK